MQRLLTYMYPVHYHGLFNIISIIIIIIIIIISFKQGIYTHIPETNYVPREYIVAAILLLLLSSLLSFTAIQFSLDGISPYTTTKLE